jgi:hypothetical protein
MSDMAQGLAPASKKALVNNHSAQGQPSNVTLASAAMRRGYGQPPAKASPRHGRHFGGVALYPAVSFRVFRVFRGLLPYFFSS